MKKILLFLALALAYGQRAESQIPLTKLVKKEVVDSLSKSLIKNYIFPDTARRMGNKIRENLAKGLYDTISNPRDFARKLTKDLRSVYNDLHLSMNFNPNAEKNLMDTSPKNTAENDAKDLEAARSQNYGFIKTELLKGNVGYVQFNQFYPLTDDAKKTVESAFTFLKYSDGLIINLRDNRGGSPDMVKYICSFLFSKPTHINDLFEHRTGKTQQYWTEPVKGYEGLTGIPVYVLTNGRTFSAAEEFAYDLQSQRRGKVVGEATGGGAHPVSFQLTGHGFIALVPYARALNPITKTNWEAVGVKPDLAVDPDNAIDAALLNFYDDRIAVLTDSVTKAPFAWDRAMLYANLHPQIVDPSLLKSYTGIFKFRENVGETITFEQGALYAKAEVGKSSRLIALSANIFKPEHNDTYKLEFVKDATGQISQVKLIFDDGSARIDKKEK
ncbi:MAG: S41 family peptidase [Bacteroidota bacterium]